MGIDFSHGGAHWSYSGFHSARTRLAKEVSVELDDMVGFKRGKDKTPGRSWDTVVGPIKDLLNHSDCDGHLTPDQCRTIAPRLRELVEKWDGDDQYDKDTFIELARGMELAANAETNFMFW